MKTKRNPTKKEAHFMEVTVPSLVARLTAAAERGDVAAIEEVQQELADAFLRLPVIQEKEHSTPRC
jgi:hypothetical protein